MPAANLKRDDDTRITRKILHSASTGIRWGLVWGLREPLNETITTQEYNNDHIFKRK